MKIHRYAAFTKQKYEPGLGGFEDLIGTFENEKSAVYAIENRCSQGGMDSPDSGRVVDLSDMSVLSIVVNGVWYSSFSEYYEKTC